MELIANLSLGFGVAFTPINLLYALIGSAAMLTTCWLVTLALPVTVRRTDHRAWPAGASIEAPMPPSTADAGVRAEARS